MVEPVTTQKSGMVVIPQLMALVVMWPRVMVIIISTCNGADNYFQNQTSSVVKQPPATPSHQIIVGHYFGAMATMKIVTIGVLILVDTGLIDN